MLNAEESKEVRQKQGGRQSASRGVAQPGTKAFPKNIIRPDSYVSVGQVDYRLLHFWLCIEHAGHLAVLFRTY
jgi:hypothetical protein